MNTFLVTGFIPIMKPVVLSAEQDCNLGVHIFYQVEMLCFRTDALGS